MEVRPAGLYEGGEGETGEGDPAAHHGGAHGDGEGGEQLGAQRRAGRLSSLSAHSPVTAHSGRYAVCSAELNWFPPDRFSSVLLSPNIRPLKCFKLTEKHRVYNLMIAQERNYHTLPFLT